MRVTHNFGKKRSNSSKLQYICKLKQINSTQLYIFETIIYYYIVLF